MGFKAKYKNLDAFGKWIIKGFGIALILALIITVLVIKF